MVILRMNRWMDSVKNLTTEAETELLECLRTCLIEGVYNKQDIGVSNQESRTRTLCANHNEDGKKYLGSGVLTPESNKLPIYINLDTPEGAQHKCSGINLDTPEGAGHKCSDCDNGEDDSEDYSISPEICGDQIVRDPSKSNKKIPSVTYEADIAGLDENDIGYDGLSCYERICCDRSYDGMTNSEDSRLCYGISGICTPSYTYLFIYIFIKKLR